MRAIQQTLWKVLELVLSHHVDDLRVHQKVLPLFHFSIPTTASIFRPFHERPSLRSFKQVSVLPKGCARELGEECKASSEFHVLYQGHRNGQMGKNTAVKVRRELRKTMTVVYKSDLEM